MYVNNWQILILFINGHHCARWVWTCWTVRIIPWNWSHLKHLAMTISNLYSTWYLLFIIFDTITTIRNNLENYMLKWIIFDQGSKRFLLLAHSEGAGCDKSSLVFNLILFSASFIVFLFSHHRLWYHGNIISSQEASELDDIELYHSINFALKSINFL